MIQWQDMRQRKFCYGTMLNKVPLHMSQKWHVFMISKGILLKNSPQLAQLLFNAYDMAVISLEIL